MNGTPMLTSHVAVRAPLFTSHVAVRAPLYTSHVAACTPRRAPRHPNRLGLSV
ncbi:MAG: hypothetical protein WA624_12805 [Methylocella sp.]